MRRQKEGVAPGKDTTPSGQWLVATRPMRSLADKEDGPRLGMRETVLSVVVGSAFLFAFMWLSASL